MSLFAKDEQRKRHEAEEKLLEARSEIERLRRLLETSEMTVAKLLSVPMKK